MTEDALMANYESAVNRAGLQKDFDLKVMQYRQRTSFFGEDFCPTLSRSSASGTSCRTPRLWQTPPWAPTRPP